MITCIKLLWIIEGHPIVGGAHTLVAFSEDDNSFPFFESLIRENPQNQIYRFLLGTDRSVFMRRPVVVIDILKGNTITFSLDINEVFQEGQSLSFEVTEQILLSSPTHAGKLELQEHAGPFFHEMWPHRLYMSAKVNWGNGI